MNFKDNLIEYKCCVVTKLIKKKFHENLKKKSVNTYKFPNHDINKFVLSLRKGVHPYEYTDDWDNFNETLLAEKVA